MRKKVENVPRAPDGSGLTRREVMVGAAVAALAVQVPLAKAATSRGSGQGARAVPTSSPIRRYMAAAATLGDGRLLITGGYDRPFDEKTSPKALNTAMIYDPVSGRCSSAAPMGVPRARHAAVTLSDGRVAVLGGLGMNATASVEIYDPQTNSWSTSAPLAQPRYDHTAAVVGQDVYVLGGSSQSMMSSVEVVRPSAESQRLP
jgi:N-acetylneuraminic acid mutarotase